MSFNKRTWVNRLSEYPNRRKLIDEAGAEKTYTVERYEGEISAEGDAWSAANMNDLEQRIADGIDGTASSLAVAEDGANSEHAYLAGSFLSHKGVLYEVVASIAKGDKLDTVTNIKQVTVGQMLEHLVANQKSFVFAYDAATSRYGYTIDGVFHPFRNPTGNAAAADVLSGKIFSSASQENVEGTMPNRGNLNVTLTPTGNNTATQTVAAGYYSGGTITADGNSSYNTGYANGRNSAHLVTYKGLQDGGSIYAILEVDGQQKYKGNSANTNFTTYIWNTSINIQSGDVNGSIIAHLYINGTEVFNDNIPNIYHYGRSLIVYG